MFTIIVAILVTNVSIENAASIFEVEYKDSVN
jgi:hypothetical protein